MLNKKIQFNIIDKYIYGVIYQYSLDNLVMTYISSSLQEILGYLPDEWLRPMNEIFELNPDNQLWQSALEKHKKGEIVEPFIVKLLHFEGNILILEANEQLLFDENDKPYAVLGMIREITKCELSRQELENHSRALEKEVNKRNQVLWDSLKRIAVLHDITYTMLSYQKLQEVVSIIGEKIAQLIPFIIMKLALYEDKEDLVHLYTVVNNEVGTVEESYLADWQNSEIGQSILEHHPFLRSTLEDDIKFEDDKVLQAQGIKSTLTAPIMLKNCVLGALSLLSDEPNNFTREHLDILNQICIQMAAILENNRLLEKLRRKAEDLENANKELQQLDQLKSEFLARVSHELRTPMTALLLAVELAQHSAGSTEEANIYVEAYKEGQQLLSLINDLLDFARLESGGLELNLDILDIMALLNDILNGISSRIEKKNLTLELDYGNQSLPNIIVDYNRISQVLLHLLDNAIKFTEEGGIYIKIDKDEENMIEIKIKDTGIGISAEDHKQLFKKFHQIDGSYTRKYGGTGLGLVISKRFIEAMNGTIEIKSQGEGQGTTVIVKLPSVAK